MSSMKISNSKIQCPCTKDCAYRTSKCKLVCAAYKEYEQEKKAEDIAKAADYRRKLYQDVDIRTRLDRYYSEKRSERLKNQNYKTC